MSRQENLSVTSPVVFSPDGTILASGMWPNVQLWDLATREQLATLEGHTSSTDPLYHPTYVAFAPDGTTLSGSEDSTILLWDVQLALPHPRSLTKLSGDDQQGMLTLQLANPFVVEVRDQNGKVFEGAQVTFMVTAGTGTLSAETTTTDARGRATSTLTLGSDPGQITIVATVEGLESVTFSAVGQAVPQTLTKVSGDEQKGAAGAQLAEPFVVSVLDQNGTPYAGAVVTFVITAGDGTLSVGTATTDSVGNAAATLTLGSGPGPITVGATVADLEPVTFSAIAEAVSDFDGDGVTSFADFFLFADAFGQPARSKLIADPLAREMIGLPDSPHLQQNMPYPFNSQTVISWFLLQPGLARLEVFALTGQRVAVLR